MGMQNQDLSINLPHNTVMFSLNVYFRVKTQHTLSGNNCFRFANMLFLEQKLSVEIAHVNGVKIDLAIESFLNGAT